MTAKINFSNDHLEKLKVWFDINPNPGRVQVDHIASQIGSLSAHVWIWFHRQRKRVEANPEASPLKAKTISRSKGTSSSLHNTDSLISTRSFSKRLESNSRRDQDVRKHGKETVDPKYRKQERLKAKKGVVRGIQRKADTRQRVGLRSAEGCFKGAEREVGRRQGTHVTFAEDVEVSRMQESGVMQKPDPVQNCSERIDKVVESLEHRMLRSSPRKSTTTPVIGDRQELCDTKLCEEHVYTGDKDSHYQGSARKSAPGSMSRIVKEFDNQKSMRKKSMPMSEKKVLREADSQNFGVQMSKVRRENIESREHYRVNRTTQDGFSRAEKVLMKKHSALINFKKADHVKQCLPSDKTKAKVFVKKMDASGINTHGGHKRVIESEGKHRKGLITRSACIDETSKAERKKERQMNVSVRRKVTENLKSPKSEHHRAAELNLRHLKPQQPLTKVSSSSNSRVKSKSKTIKEKAILAKKTNLLKNKMKGDDVCQAAIDSGKPKVPSIMPVGKRRSREGLFSAISMPQAKAQGDLSDSSDAEDFQDDRYKKNHKLSKKKVVTTDSLNKGKSIPVLSGKRQNIALADCSNRVTAGRNLGRIPLESANQMHCANKKNKKTVSPVKCGVSSTVSSQSSVISSTVEENSVPRNCCEDTSKPPYPPVSISVGKDKPCLLQEKKIKPKETEEEFVKKSGPVISYDKIWNPYSGEFLFKRELSVNLIKINLSSNSDEREVMVSSKMNPTNQKENKEDDQLWKDDRTDINSNMSENMSTQPKVVERSIWNSIASSVETSSKIWQSIASSTEASPKEIPFIDGSSCLDKKSTDLWSSIASSVEMSHKDIPFIERSISPEGESTPSSSQDTVACNEDPSRAKTKGMFDEDSCEVSSSVDLEKVPSDLSEDVDSIEESEETSSSNLVETNEGEDIAAAVMETKEDNVEFSEGDTKSINKVEKISASEQEVNVEEHEKPAIDVLSDKYDSSKVDLLKTKKNFGKTTLAFIESSEKAETSSNDKEFHETPEESPKVMEMDRKDLLKPERNAGGIKRTGTLEEVSPVECNKMSANVMENSEISPDEENASAGEKPASPVDDLYETIDSPDYDIGSPFVVVDEIGGSDTEENKSNGNGRQEESSEDLDSLNISVKPIPEFVNISTKVSEIIDLDSSDDDEVVLVSLVPRKKARRIPIRDKLLKGHLSSHNKNQLEVIDLDCNSEDDEIQVSTVAPNTPTSLEIKTSDCSNVTEKQSIQNDVPSVEVNGTSPHPPTVEHEQSKEQVVSQSTGTESSKHDAVLDMTCETVSVESNGCVDKSPDIFYASTLNNECNESLESKNSSSDELVVDMEKCDKMDCPLQEQDVPTSLKDVRDEPVDQSDGGKDSSLDELVIDMEACRKMDCPQEDQGVPTSLKSSVGDPVEQSVGHNNSPSDELIIDRETCNKTDCPQKDQGVPASRKNAVDDKIGQTSGLKDSSSDELVIDTEACDKMDSLQLDQGVPTTLENAVNDPVVQSVGHKDSSSDELVIDMKPCKNLICPCPDQGVSNLEPDDAAILNPSPLGIGNNDSSADELVIDMEVCEKVNNTIQDKGIPASLKGADLPDYPSKESVECDDSNSDTLVIDMKECDKMDSLQLDQGVSTSLEDDPVEQSVGRKDSSSDELVIDMKHCDKVNRLCLDQGISAPLEHNTTSLNLSELGGGHSDSSADELVIDMEACDKMEYLPKEQEAPEGTNYFPVDHLEDNIQHKLPDSCERNPGSSADSRLGALEGFVKDKSDKVEQDAEMEKSDESVKGVKVCGELMGLLKAMDSPKRTIPTFSKINTPQWGNEVGDSTSTKGGPVESSVTENTPSRKNEATSSSDAIEDKLDPAKQPLVHDDATSDDDVLIDVVTADPSECPLSITMFKNGADTSPDSLIPSAAKTSASVENSKSLVANVLDKDRMEDPVTNRLEPSINKETPGNDTTDQGEDQDLTSTKDSALSCYDSKCQEGDSSSLGSSATIGGGPPQAVLSRDTPEKQLPESGIQIKSEPDAGAVEDTPSGSITPDEDSKQANKENPQEKMKRPKSLNQLVSALTHRLGLIAKYVTPSTSNLDLPRSTVGINHKASHSKPLSSSPTEGALQPPKPIQEPKRGTKRRMITNKNLKRPPIPEKVQMRIQQLNPFPCDHGWQHNAAVVELAQREVELDCQPGEHIALTGPPIEQLLGTRGSTSGNVNFCYQPGMDPVNATSRDTMTEDLLGVPVKTNNNESGSLPVSQGNSSQVVESHPLLTGMLSGADARGTEPLKRKRSRTASGNSKKGKKSRRRRRKSSDDVAWEISSRADALANGTFSEKDIREEWMQLLKVMEESTQSGNEEQLSNSETILPSSSIPASASERLPGHQADGPVEGLPSLSVQESDTSSITDTASEKDDLSGMPLILRVFSLRDEEPENNLALESTGFSSFDLDSARIIETQDASQVYSMAATAAAATAARRHSQESSNLTVSSQQEVIRKRRSSQTFGSADGVPPSKVVAAGSNSAVGQVIQTNPIISSQQVPSRVCNQSGNLPDTVQPMAASGMSQTVLNSPLMSPSSSGMQNLTVLPSQPASMFIPVQPKPSQQVSQQRRSSLESLLNPLILNQQIQTYRLSASPPLCTPYPTTSGPLVRTVLGPSAPSGNIQNPGIGYLGGSITLPTANVQWTEAPPNVQLAPVTTQSYTNGVDSRSTIFYTPQVSTVTYLTGSPQ